jgi:peptidoglycan/xylan/chitin deacetylase (PgdA/CDA1 family)
LHRCYVNSLRKKAEDRWPIDPISAHNKPSGWNGWPDGKKFALVLTHDVDTDKGQKKCRCLMDIEQSIGLIASYNIVPERYRLDHELLKEIGERGFELGIHGLNHDGMLFDSKPDFDRQAIAINRYIKQWGCTGFRAPAMQHNLDWIHDFDIEYDASTFDTDPFEPQSDSLGTIYPLWIPPLNGRPGYIELPYTMPQDFTLFILMREKTDLIWRKKLEWVALHGGMVLMLTHPDYMQTGQGRCGFEEYPAELYSQFLEMVVKNYRGQFWNALPCDVACYARARLSPDYTVKEDSARSVSPAFSPAGMLKENLCE